MTGNYSLANIPTSFLFANDYFTGVPLATNKLSRNTELGKFGALKGHSDFSNCLLSANIFNFEIFRISTYTLRYLPKSSWFGQAVFVIAVVSNKNLTLFILKSLM